jgi:hypothetical protein
VAFVRYKSVKGKKYYQVVRNYREDGKHKQEVLCHLGPHRSLQEAIDATRVKAEHFQDMFSYYSDEARHFLEEAQRRAMTMREVCGDDLSVNYEVPTREAAWTIVDAVDAEYDPYCSTEEWQQWKERLNAAEDLVRQTEQHDDAVYWADYFRSLLKDNRDRLAELLKVREEYF